MYIFRGGTGDEILNSLGLPHIKEYVDHEADGHCGKRHRLRMLYHDLLRLVLELIDDQPGEDIKPKEPHQPGPRLQLRWFAASGRLLPRPGNGGSMYAQVVLVLQRLHTL